MGAQNPIISLTKTRALLAAFRAVFSVGLIAVHP